MKKTITFAPTSFCMVFLLVHMFTFGGAFSPSNSFVCQVPTNFPSIRPSYRQHQIQKTKIQNLDPRLRERCSMSMNGNIFGQSGRGITNAIFRLRRSIAQWKKKIFQLKTSNRLQSLFAAVIFSFSVVFCFQEKVSEFRNIPFDNSVHRVTIQQNMHVRRESMIGMTRGGATTSSRSYPDFSFLRPKKGEQPMKQSKVHQMESTLEDNIAQAGKVTSRTLKEALLDLAKYMRGPKSDTLIVLLATALVTPLCKNAGMNPILGFLASGMLLGPNGFGLIRGIHTTEVFAELGIVFFLFEMGIELSIDRLMQMRRDVFGLGLGQFLLTGVAFAGVGSLLGLPSNAQVVLGGGLALSSSAFVLQLLKDKNQLATRFGKASFGILLFQDLAVVPLLVVTPILAGSGSGLTAAVGAALLKATIALGSIALAGRYVLGRLYKTVAAANSQEAFLGLVLLTVLSMSFMTEGLGLSNTLGAFLAGVLLSETKYRYQVEADIAPFRGILLGLFFLTVGYEIDLRLIFARLPVVLSLVAGLMGLKAAITTMLSLGFGLSLPTSIQTGLILSQGGEFAFVAFGLARSLGILDVPTTKLLLTSASLTMALTPSFASVGAKLAKRLEEKSDFTHYLGQDTDATEIKNSDEFAVVVGYGEVGQVVCNLLDRKLIKYVGLETDPNKAILARNSGLPVFFGDIGRQEVAEAFNVGKAKIVVVCISDKAQVTRVVIALRRWYPDLKIFCRAVDSDHQSRLQNTLNVAAMVPVLPEDTILMTLPFGAAVMRSFGVPAEEVAAIIEGKKREVMMGKSAIAVEEEEVLAQLGISNNDKEQMMDKVAAQRRLETLEKSPFVAEVIEDACPDSVFTKEEKRESPGPFSEAIVVAEGLVQDQLEKQDPQRKVDEPDVLQRLAGEEATNPATFEDETGAFQ